MRLVEAGNLQRFRRDYEKAGSPYGPELEGLIKWTQEWVLNDMQRRASESKEEGEIRWKRERAIIERYQERRHTTSE